MTLQACLQNASVWEMKDAAMRDEKRTDVEAMFEVSSTTMESSCREWVQERRLDGGEDERKGIQRFYAWTMSL